MLTLKDKRGLRPTENSRVTPAGGDPLDPEASPKNPPHLSLVPPHQSPPSKILSRGSKSPPIVDRPGGDGGGQPPNYYKISEH